MNNEDKYIVKHNSKVFEQNTIVKYIACTDSGNCYLVADLKDNLKREWIMTYDLYPINRSFPNDKFIYNDTFDKVVNKVMSDIFHRK